MRTTRGVEKKEEKERMGNFLERFGGPLFFFFGLWMVIGTPILLFQAGAPIIVFHGILYQILGLLPIVIILLFMMFAGIAIVRDNIKEIKERKDGEFWPW